MEKAKVFSLIMTAITFLALVPMRESHLVIPSITPRPLCATQISLANYACSILPITPWHPSLPMLSGDQGHHDQHEHDHEHNHERERAHEHGHRHGHGHGHRHRHHHRQTPEEDNCCRWARDVDSECVCELLVHLPPFLRRPMHQYSLKVGGSCDITYSCGSSI